MGALGLDAAKPSAKVKAVRITGLSLDGATLGFDVDVANPYAVPLPMSDLEYRLSSAGKQFVSGKANVAGTIPAKQSKLVTLPAEVKFADVLAVLSSVKPGSVVPYMAELGLSVDTPETGRLALPMQNIEGQLPVPTTPDVSVSSVKWESLTFDEAKALVDLHVVNRNQFAVALEKLNYALALGGHDVASAGVAGGAKAFSAGGANDLRIPISFSPKSMGMAVFNMLTGKGSGYTINGDMSFTSPFGPVNLPFEKQGETSFRK